MLTNILRVVFIILLAISVVSCRSPRIEILESQQGKFVFSNYQFIHEHWTAPKIAQLYNQEKLYQLVKNPADSWETQQAICNWTNAQFPPGYPDPYPLSNGVDILADIRSGKTHGFCGQYAYLFADALKALGYYDVRYVELSGKNGDSHFTTEIWSDRWQKWVVLDPFYNVYYTKDDDVPLSAMELHDFAIANQGSKPRIHMIEKRGYQQSATNSVDLYYAFAISLRNNFARWTIPVTVADRQKMFLTFRDPRLPPAPDPPNESSRMEDFQYTCNQVAIRTQLDEKNGIIHCTFQTESTVPHFKIFLASIDNQDWKESDGEFDWKLVPGKNLLQVTALNVYNHRSNVATLLVRYTR